MIYSFGPVRDEVQTYSDGTQVPRRFQYVYLDGKRIGYLEIHMHKNSKGVSFGMTPVVYFNTKPGKA